MLRSGVADLHKRDACAFQDAVNAGSVQLVQESVSFSSNPGHHHDNPSSGGGSGLGVKDTKTGRTLSLAQALDKGQSGSFLRRKKYLGKF